MRGELEKSVHKFYVGRANPTRFLQAMCGAGQPALPPLILINFLFSSNYEGLR